jgi:hypothetical protein
MLMPYNLQRLPREALEVLRFMLTQQEAVSPAQIEAGAGLHTRLVGRAIRRLVNYDQIEMPARRSGTYVLTEDGRITARQLLEYEAAQHSAGKQDGVAAKVYLRRLTVVVPRALRADVPSVIYVGVNPPTSGDPVLPEAAQLSLRLSAVGGALSAQQLSLSVPPDKAAAPSRLNLVPAQAGRPVRVRMDAYQLIDLDEAHPLGGMYFDVKAPLTPDPDDKSVRAVGIDLMFKVK